MYHQKALILIMHSIYIFLWIFKIIWEEVLLTSHLFDSTGSLWIFIALIGGVQSMAARQTPGKRLDVNGNCKCSILSNKSTSFPVTTMQQIW